MTMVTLTNKSFDCEDVRMNACLFRLIAVRIARLKCTIKTSDKMRLIVTMFAQAIDQKDQERGNLHDQAQ